MKIFGTFRRPPSAVVGLDSVFDAPLWNREHFELFLKPGESASEVVQIGVGSDGATETLWHGCDNEPDLEWHATTARDGDVWRMTLDFPLNQLAEQSDFGSDVEWQYFAGFGMLTGSAGWTEWQARGHDPMGVVADPLFVDPARGDFRVSSQSPALALGFVPFDFSSAGVRSLECFG